ncbi:nudix hydrolase 10 [Rosa chinensis]|uniref:nudix hydrolase 10 n=1 Tax=Rosa chinensis TaxID=74649 RepID=UPI001AD9441D|nr:nudix hydrolase 10 [Rosa chinensis]
MSVSVNSSDQVCENGTAELLPATNDDHGGVIVDMKDAMEPQAFRALLRASIVQWRLQGKKGVWIKLPIELVNLVEMVVKEGFHYHHAEPHYLMLVYWIPETTNTIPANASHRVGVGAIILNDKNEMLVVQEKSGRLQGTGVWKIPTGIVDEGEDITVAAVREVKEETGIDAEFSEEVGSVFVCMMRPLSFDIQKQDLEIEAAKWISLEEFAAQPVTQKHGLFKCIHELCLAKLALLPEPGGRRRMFPLKLAVFFTALCLSVFSNLVFIKEISGDATPSSPSANCVTCTTCQYPCPPAGGDPLYPPPPPYKPGVPATATTATAQQPSHQGKCPQVSISVANTLRDTPSGPDSSVPHPPGTFGGGGGGYVPYPYNSASSSPLSVLLSVLVMMLFSSAVFL